MTNAPDDARSTDRLAARLLDAEKEVTAASTALREFIRTGERYSASSKTLDDAVIGLAPVRDALQQAVTSLGSAVSALQTGLDALQGTDPVRLREELGGRITAVYGALDALRTQVANAVAQAESHRNTGVAEVTTNLAEVQKVLEGRLTDGFADVAKQGQEAAQEDVRHREQQRANMASLFNSLAEQREVLQRGMAQVEASKALLTKLIVGGFVVLGAVLAVVVYRLLMN